MIELRVSVLVPGSGPVVIVVAAPPELVGGGAPRPPQVGVTRPLFQFGGDPLHPARLVRLRGLGDRGARLGVVEVCL